MSNRDKLLRVAWCAIATIWLGFMASISLDIAQEFYLNGEMAGIDMLQRGYVMAVFLSVAACVLAGIAYGVRHDL